MARFLIGIGGSGQNTVLCYLRLSLLCGLDARGLHVAVIDADRRGGVSEQLAELSRVLGTEAPAFIDPYPVLSPNQRTLRDVFSDVPQAAEVLSVLFSRDQLAVPVREGMFGQPPVGTTVIAAKLDRVTANQDDDSELTDLIARMRGSHRIAVVGSLFGGTGSGGVPALCRFLRSQTSSEPEVTALAYLPWFNLTSAGVDAQRSGVAGVNADGMERNAASCLAFFHEELARHVRRLILLGLDDDLPPRKWTGPVAQPEHAHFVPLVGAYALHEGMLEARLPQKDGEILAYFYDEIQRGDGQTRGGIEPRNLPISGRPSRPNSLLECVRETRAAIAMIERFCAYVDSLPRFTFFPNTEVPPWLRAFSRRVAQVHGEEQGTRAVVQGLKRYAALYERTVEWFQSLNCDKFRFEPGDLELGDAFQATLRQPVPFIHRWFDRLPRSMPIRDALNDFPDAVCRAMVHELRIQIADFGG